MPKKRYNAEEIIQKLRGADVLLSQGKTVSPAASHDILEFRRCDCNA
jgi:hypothetical protein